MIKILAAMVLVTASNLAFASESNSDSYSSSNSNYSYEDPKKVSSVPIPGTLALFCSGMVGLIAMRKKK